MPDRPLAGITVAVTRPAAQAGPTLAALEVAGAAAIAMPVLAIHGLPFDRPAAPLAAAVFVSVNAVQHGAAVLAGFAGRAYAVGDSTAAALRAAGAADVVSPQQSQDSEGLLALSSLQAAHVRGQHIAIVRGDSERGGRRMIEDTLAARGAIMHRLTCYRREAILPPAPAVAALAAALDKNDRDTAVTAMSVETLDSLAAAFPAWARARVLVPHARVAAAAGSRGARRVHVVPPEPALLVAALATLIATPTEPTS